MAVLALLAFAGCADAPHYDVDGGTFDASITEAKRLSIVGSPTVSLTTADEATLTVRLDDANGQPMAGSEVRFALDGRAHDSSLTELSVTTDANGLGETTLHAGTVLAAFRVRASTDDAASVWFDIAVGDSGFGRLEVTPDYRGSRALPQVEVGVYTDATCEDDRVRRSGADRVQALSADDELVVFLGLPVGPTYAVAVRGVGDEGGLLAWGCEDGATVTEDAITELRVRFDDEPLTVDGSYSATADFSMLATSERVADRLGEETATLLPRTDAALILDAAEDQLRTSGDTAAATMLAAARAGGYDDVYQDMLDDGGLGPREAHATFIARIREGLGSVGITGRLRLTDGVVTYAVTKLVVGTRGLDVMLAGLEIPASIDATSTDETVTIDSLSIDLSASLLVQALAIREAFDNVVADAVAWLSFHAGCGMLPAPTEPIGCDADCLRMACQSVIATYYEDALATLETIDRERATFELSGEAMLEAMRDILQADTVMGRLGGVWTGPEATEPEAVEGMLTGERITPPT